MVRQKQKKKIRSIQKSHGAAETKIIFPSVFVSAENNSNIPRLSTAYANKRGSRSELRYVSVFVVSFIAVCHLNVPVSEDSE